MIEVGTGNGFLANLSIADAQALQHHLRLVSLPKGEVLYQATAAIPYAYFPVDALVSLFTRTADGAMIETAAIGTDGVVGSALAGGLATAFDDAVVTFAGSAWRIGSVAFIAACQRSRSLQAAAHAQTARLVMQAQQVAACAVLHPLEQRLATWLLQMRDRLGSNSLAVSQEYRSQVLGVQRTTVTLAEKNLQAAALLQVRRGTVDIIDPVGLESAACECYGALKRKLKAHHHHAHTAPIVLAPSLDHSISEDAANQALAERMTGILPQREAN